MEINSINKYGEDDFMYDNSLILINKTILQSGDKLTIPLPAEVCNQLKLNKGDRIGGIFDKDTGILIFQKGEIAL